jgi:hypothetical protein
MIVKQTFLAASLLLLTLPATAMQIDYGNSALDIQFDTTWTLDGQPTTIKTGSLTIGNGATFSLLDNPGQSVEWFAGTIDIQGNFFAPGLNLIFHADQITFNGSLSAGSLAFFSNSQGTSGCGGTGASGTIGSSPTTCVVNGVITSSTSLIGDAVSGSIDQVAGPVITYGGTISDGEITFIQQNTVTLVPLSDGALYFSAALLPLLRRVIRRKQLPAA